MYINQLTSYDDNDDKTVQDVGCCICKIDNEFNPTKITLLKPDKEKVKERKNKKMILEKRQR